MTVGLFQQPAKAGSMRMPEKLRLVKDSARITTEAQRHRVSHFHFRLWASVPLWFAMGIVGILHIFSLLPDGFGLRGENWPVQEFFCKNNPTKLLKALDSVAKRDKTIPNSDSSE
jgi:hypothetical protein